jgi:SAM-dependent methyltransferase
MTDLSIQDLTAQEHTMLASVWRHSTPPDDIRACPLCGEQRAKELLTVSARSQDGALYRVVTCRKCALRYTRPLPQQDEMIALYDEGYQVYAKADTRTRRGLPLNMAALTRAFKASMLWERRRALLNRPPGHALDVGCGNGDFLAALKAQGWHVSGTEFSAVACRQARQKGITVHQGGLATADFPEATFDTICLWHVLEHLPDPLADLAVARKLLRDDGLLVLEVPNSAHPTFRLCGNDWCQLDVPRHLQHFTPTTLRRCLAQAGFTIVARRNWHLWDFAYDLYSLLHHWRMPERCGIRFFSTDFGRAPLRAKITFLSSAILLAAICLPYSLIVALLGKHGETITVTARKVPSTGTRTRH